jgi:NADH:ubiquinone oxidoreductase subunit B-like Fe-S oxidoreductase
LTFYHVCAIIEFMPIFAYSHEYEATGSTLRPIRNQEGILIVKIIKEHKDAY